MNFRHSKCSRSPHFRELLRRYNHLANPLAFRAWPAARRSRGALELAPAFSFFD